MGIHFVEEFQFRVNVLWALIGSQHNFRSNHFAIAEVGSILLDPVSTDDARY